MKKNLLVVFGGRSTEHDISVLSAIQLMSAVDKNKYNLYPVYIDNDGKWFYGDALLDTKFYKDFNKNKVTEVAILPSYNYLFKKSVFGFRKLAKIDVAIISCHGKNGEDGTVQGLLELAQIPYQSSGVLGSSIGLDKFFMKQIFLQNKIPIAKFLHLTKVEFEKIDDENSIFYNNVEKLGYPVIVKPNTLGSSIGVSLCKNKEELFDALTLAFEFDNLVLVEKCIQNLIEVNISVLGDSENFILSSTEEVLNKGFLSFSKKYLSQKSTKTETKTAGSKSGMQNMDRIIPARLTKTQARQIDNLAKKIFLCLNAKGVIRIDFMIDCDTQKVYANEINTIPGSFAFYLWQKNGINFTNLVDRLVQIAEYDFKQKSKLMSTFSSNVLNQNAMNICK